MESAINLRIKTLDQKDFFVKVSPSQKVKELKTAIDKAISLDPSCQRLIYQGKLLKDEDRLSLYKIHD